MNTPFDEIQIKIDTVSTNIKIDYDLEDYESGPFEHMRNPEISYTIAIPSFIDLKINNVHGTVSLNTLDNNINIELITGELNLEQVSGNIKADLTNVDVTGTIDSTNGMSFDIINGDVRLTLNSSISAKVDAEWAHGKFEYEGLNFMNIDKESDSFRGILGTGNSDIRIDITNGKIRFFGNGTSLTL